MKLAHTLNRIRSVAPLALVLPLALTGCFSPMPTDSLSSATATPTPSPTLSVADGVRAVRIIFRDGAGGSFPATVPAGGTVPGAGSGFQATTLFKPWGDPSDASNQYAFGSDRWPAWIKDVEIGISGASNTATQNSDCARFAVTGEDTAAGCDFDSNAGTAAVPCGAPSGLYRVSEWDCGRDTDSAGNGSSSDGVYIRIDFDRSTSVLGANENILAVLRYSASAFHAAATSPTACFTSSVFTPDAAGCSDFVWQTYLKTAPTDVYSPFMMLVPPVLSPVQTTQGTSGAVVQSKQFFLPLAGNSALTEFQISRVKGMIHDGGSFDAICGASTPANSALCAGMVFYSLSLYRI